MVAVFKSRLIKKNEQFLHKKYSFIYFVDYSGLCFVMKSISHVKSIFMHANKYVDQFTSVTFIYNFVVL